MIRPLTVVTFLMACGSGLYLYQSKHEVQVLDRTIERTVHETGALREQSRLLAAEWTMLTSPERLRQFSDTYLKLKTITPSQFTSLADLDNRLPMPMVETPAHDAEEEAVPVVTDTAPQATVEPAAAIVSEEALPVPPVPATRSAPAVSSSGHSTEGKVAVARPANAEAPARPAAVAEARPSEPRTEQRTEQRAAEQRSGEQRAAPRVAEAHATVREPAAPPPRPIVLAAPRIQPAGKVADNAASAPAPAPTPGRQAMAAEASPYGGSLLGMARGATSPAPRPTPVNATYNSN